LAVKVKEVNSPLKLPVSKGNTSTQEKKLIVIMGDQDQDIMGVLRGNIFLNIEPDFFFFDVSIYFIIFSIFVSTLKNNINQ